MTTAKMAARLVAAGISVIPVKLDGSKIPSLDSWKPYQERIATAAELDQWFGGRYPKGLGIVTGRVSGNLESIDFDDLTLAEPWNELVEAECPGLTKRLVLIVTPRPGLQFWYRCASPVSGNQALAKGLRPDKDGKTRLKALIETRGEGGYAVAPGSPLAVHENGTAYKIAGGDPAEPPVITAAEREVLLRCARSLSEAVEPAQDRTTRALAPDRPAGELRPGDDFNAREDFGAYLTRQGWEVALRRGEVTYLRRPGKDRGWSATLGKAAPGVLHVFSSSAAPLEDGCNYDLFRAYAAYEHQGDLKAAARALGAKGYGAPPVRRDKPPPPDEPPPEEEPYEAGTPPPDGTDWIALHEPERKANEAKRKLEGLANGKHPLPSGKPEIYTAEELQSMQFPEMKWVIPGILSEGLCLLAGPPKSAKSAFALQTAIATAAGGRTLGKFQVEQGEVLYVALEDTKRRMKDRMLKVLGGSRAPTGLYFAHRWPKLGHGAEDEIMEWIVARSEARLVILDTFGKSRGPRKPHGNVYDDDVLTMEAIQRLAQDRRVCVLFLHHTNKKVDPEDPFHAISGSEGVSGSTDTNLILRRPRAEKRGTLFVTGKDVDEIKYEVEFDGATMTWTFIGRSDEGPKTSDQAAMLALIVSLGRPVTATEVHAAMTEHGSKRSYSSVKGMMWRLFQDGQLMLQEAGRYALPSRH